MGLWRGFGHSHSSNCWWSWRLLPSSLLCCYPPLAALRLGCKPSRAGTISDNGEQRPSCLLRIIAIFYLQMALQLQETMIPTRAGIFNCHNSWAYRVTMTCRGVQMHILTRDALFGSVRAIADAAMATTFFIIALTNMSMAQVPATIQHGSFAFHVPRSPSGSLIMEGSRQWHNGTTFIPICTARARSSSS